jgi:transcriptional/translational regulatory protein YebC/TACO1
MKKIFYYLLPLFLLSQSGTAQQDSLTLRITDEKGQIIIDKEECEMDADELMMAALDAGAEDFADEDDSYEITTAPADFDAVRTALEEAGITMASAEVTMIPQTYVTLTDEADITNIGRILDLLDDDDDVQEVYHNWEE